MRLFDTCVRHPFPQEVELATSRQKLEPYVDKIPQCIITVHGHMPSRWSADAVFECGEGGGSFRERMPKVDFNGRGEVLNPRSVCITRGE